VISWIILGLGGEVIFGQISWQQDWLLLFDASMLSTTHREFNMVLNFLCTNAHEDIHYHPANWECHL
jgi:hypothetical protein